MPGRMVVSMLLKETGYWKHLDSSWMPEVAGLCSASYRDVVGQVQVSQGRKGKADPLWLTLTRLRQVLGTESALLPPHVFPLGWASLSGRSEGIS